MAKLHKQMIYDSKDMFKNVVSFFKNISWDGANQDLVIFDFVIFDFDLRFGNLRFGNQHLVILVYHMACVTHL